MYVPDMFALDDREAAFALMRRYDFALVFTATEEGPMATHLPIMLDEARGPNGTLMGHMSRKNPHWRELGKQEQSGGESLVVFQGPHAYVSPSWYGHDGKAVPTWNYMAVHAYGQPRLDEAEGATEAHLERMVATQEASMPDPWSLDSQSEDYLSAMRRGIVAFEIPITRIEAKAKLSQNKTPEERAGVIGALAETDDPMARAVSAEMRARRDRPQ